MSELNTTFDNLSAVLDLLQNTAPPEQKPVLRLMGDHLRLLARCMDDPAVTLLYIPSGPTPQGACQATADPISMTTPAKNPLRIQGVRHVCQ
ncbi:MAG: hypothetical protein PHI96_06375 [Desulfovibrio sp.]|nr:hypothetical protein [Desulfovibrio sp.]